MLATSELHPSAITIRDGLRIPFVEHGGADGIPMMFLHGYTDSWRSFEGVLPLLPRSIRAIAISQRGHGDADRPSSGYGAPHLASDVASFMDALAIESAIIVGHSMGSYVAQRFAIDYPHRTRGVVLAGSYATMKDNPVVEELKDAVFALADPVDPGFVRAFQESTLAQPISPDFLNRMIAESLKLPARVWQEIAASWAHDGHSERLSEIAAPVLAVWGDHDAIFPLTQQMILTRGIPLSRLVVYAGGGHALHWEEPGRFAADVTAFAMNLP